jgi:hypothetical protein
MGISFFLAIHSLAKLICNMLLLISLHLFALLEDVSFVKIIEFSVNAHLVVSVFVFLTPTTPKSLNDNKLLCVWDHCTFIVFI